MGTRCTLLRPGILAYQHAWELQRRLAADVRAGAEPTLILLQHPPTYTLGVRGNEAHLLAGEGAWRARGVDVVRSDRGGDVTFHGPGQIVGYPIINLRRALGLGPSAYVRTLEALIIDTLGGFGIAAARFAGRPGVWCGRDKIAAIGVRVSRGVTTHGFALNVNTDLSYFQQIIPCGYSDTGVTSMECVAGRAFDIAAVEDALATAFAERFGFEMRAGTPAEQAVAIGR